MNANEIKIEKNVPNVETRGKNKNGMTSLLRQMEIGDSFLIPRAYRSNMYSIAKASDVKISIKVADSENIRVWRTK